MPSPLCLPLDRCPTCGRPWRGPDTPCACGDYRSPPAPWVLSDEHRQAGLAGVAEARRRLARARAVRDALHTLDEHCA